MLGTILVDRLDQVLRTAAPLNAQRAFGGYRMIFVGDFGQCPPVRCGGPLHAHRLFGDFEVALLTLSHRVTETRSKEICVAIRTRRMTHGIAEEIRDTSCASRNRARAVL